MPWWSQSRKTTTSQRIKRSSGQHSTAQHSMACRAAGAPGHCWFWSPWKQPFSQHISRSEQNHCSCSVQWHMLTCLRPPLPDPKAHPGIWFYFLSCWSYSSVHVHNLLLGHLQHLLTFSECCASSQFIPAQRYLAFPVQSRLSLLAWGWHWALSSTGLGPDCATSVRSAELQGPICDHDCRQPRSPAALTAACSRKVTAGCVAAHPVSHPSPPLSQQSSVLLCCMGLHRHCTASGRIPPAVPVCSCLEPPAQPFADGSGCVAAAQLQAGERGESHGSSSCSHVHTTENCS